MQRGAVLGPSSFYHASFQFLVLSLPRLEICEMPQQALHSSPNPMTSSQHLATTGEQCDSHCFLFWGWGPVFGNHLTWRCAQILLEEQNWASVTRRLCHWLFSEAQHTMGEGNRRGLYVLSTWAAITECPMLCGLNNQICVLSSAGWDIQDHGDCRPSVW